jgi:hypothetical protein
MGAANREMNTQMPFSKFQRPAFREYRAISRKPRHLEKAMSFRENAHHARSSLHDIVEKLTATIGSLFVVRRSLQASRSRRSHGQNHPRYRMGALIFFAEARTCRFRI